jgi:hypothetical protein
MVNVNTVIKEAPVSSMFNPAIIFYIISGILVIIILVYSIKSFYRNWNGVSSPGNILAIQKSQNIILEAQWAGRLQARQGINASFSKTPPPQHLLINTAVLSTRLTGFLGPYESGVFDEDNATRLSLTAGARCLILEIDYENNIYEPKLIYRDGWNMKQSLNTGNINAVAKSIASRAFKPDNNGAPASVANDPLIIVLYFVRLPNKSTQSLDYVRYLGKVAAQLDPIKNLLIGITPQGDFRRQGLESQLFFMPTSIYQNKIILLTNADTTLFRNINNIGLSGEIGVKEDLDFMIHARLYGRESPSPFGITGSPSSSVKPAAVITTPEYWTMTPPDRVESAVQSTKESWTLVMTPVSSATNQIKEVDMNNLLKIYGVNSIPFTLFSDSKLTDIYTATGKPFNTTSWIAKPQLIQYIPPAPIPIAKPFPQANSGGGTVIAPKL